MLTVFLVIYVVVGLLFLAGVAAAASRPVPRMDSEGVVIPFSAKGSGSGELPLQKAA
jgi:hypothetical protein